MESKLNQTLWTASSVNSQKKAYSKMETDARDIDEERNINVSVSYKGSSALKGSSDTLVKSKGNVWKNALKDFRRSHFNNR